MHEQELTAEIQVSQIHAVLLLNRLNRRWFSLELHADLQRTGGQQQRFCTVAHRASKQQPRPMHSRDRFVPNTRDLARTKDHCDQGTCGIARGSG